MRLLYGLLYSLNAAESVDVDLGDVLAAASFFLETMCIYVQRLRVSLAERRMYIRNRETHIHERNTHSLFGTKMDERRPCQRITDAKL